MNREEKINKHNLFKYNTQNNTFYPNISLCSRSMDRNFHLEETIPTWVDIPEISEIIIVDWSSSVPVKDIVGKYQNGKITVIRVNNKSYFDGVTSRNIGIRFARYEHIFVVDADVKINNNIFKNIDIKLDSNRFYTGNYKDIENTSSENKWSSGGTCMITKTMFNAVNGFNENMSNFRYQDTEFKLRLRKAGYKLSTKIAEYLTPIHHDSILRVINFEMPEYDLKKLQYESEKFLNGYLNKWVMKQLEVDIFYPDGRVETRVI